MLKITEAFGAKSEGFILFGLYKHTNGHYWTTEILKVLTVVNVSCFAGSDSTLATVPSSADQPSSSSFNRFIDSAAVEAALRDGCLACVHHILSFIRSQLAVASPDARPTCLSSVLFMARLSQSMGKLCPNLKHCILGKQCGFDSTAKGTPRQGKKLGKATAAAEVRPSQDKWEELKEELLGCSMEAYRIWSAALSKVRHSHKCTCKLDMWLVSVYGEVCRNLIEQ